MANIDIRKNDPLLTFDRGFALAPEFEVEETNDAYLFKATVPGVKREDIEVKHTAKMLTISGKTEAEKEEKSDTSYTYQRTYGSFTRSFPMPEGVDTDAVKTDLREGILTVNVPKKAKA